MKEKVGKTILTILTIFVLTFSYFVILGNVISYALDSLEEQTIKVNEQIDFDVYFKDGQNRVHTKLNNIKNGENLYLNINVKDSGVLSDGKITINNPNFEIGNIKNNFVKEVNGKNNEIVLNSIQYGNNVEIEIPISMKKQNIVENDYFEREVVFNLSGKFTDANYKESTVGSEIKVKNMWTEDVDLSINTSIDKYISLGDNKILLEQTIESNVNDNVLPKSNEKITTTLPLINEKYPSEIKVLKNGVKLENIEYNNQDGSVVVNTKNDDDKIIWNDGKDIYNVIAIYEGQLEIKNIDLNTTVITNVYTKNEEITKNDVKNIVLEKKGQILSAKVSSTESVYKGYMYANTQNETIYNQDYNAQISDANSLEKIELKLEEDKFETQDTKTLSTNNGTYFKEIRVNKNNLQTILGNDGKLKVLDENDTEIASANIDCNEDENGDIVLKRVDTNNNQVDLQLKNIKIVTTKPIIEGELKIKAIKAIKGNCGYDKQTLKTLNKLTSTIKVVSNNEEEIINTDTLLNDTKTMAKLEISNNNLSTLETNKGVQITATLVTNSSEYDLYKNPTINIELPKEIETIKITSAKVLYNEGLKTVKNKVVTNEEGAKTIELAFSGEQTSFGNDVYEGMQVVIFADLTLNKLTPNKKTNMKMTYTNENANEIKYEQNVQININSKDGVMLYNNVSGFNNNDVLETLSDKIPEGILETNSEEKTLTAKMAIINNYETQITNVSIIGKIPGKIKDKIGNMDLEGTFNTNILEGITTNYEGAKVYYSEDENADTKSDTWKENIDNAKAYKIELPQDVLINGGKVEFNYKFKIPENLGNNESIYSAYKVEYEYAGQKVQTDSAVVLKTKSNEENKSDNEADNNDIANDGTKYTIEPISQIDENQKQIVDLADGVRATITASVSDKYLKENDIVNEGQNIKYFITINNNSGNDISNLNLIANQSNVSFYGIEKVKMGSNEFKDDGTGKVQIDTNWYVLKNGESTKNITENEKIENGTSKTFSYEVQVNKVENQNDLITGTLKITSDTITKDIDLNKINIEKGKIALSLLKNNYVEYPYEVEYPESIKLSIKNISDSEITNQKISIPLNNQITISKVETEDEKEVEYKVENDVLNINVDKLNAEEQKDIYILFEIKRFDGGYTDIILEATSQNDNISYYSNKFIEGVEFNLSKITVKQTAQKENEMLNINEEFSVTLEITNNANFTDNITINKSFIYPISLIKLTKDGEEQEISDNGSQINITDSLEAGKTVKYVYTFKVNSNLYDATSITLNFDISANSYYEKTPDIYYDLNNNTYDDNKNDDDTNEDDDNIIDDPTDKKETDTKIDPSVDSNRFMLSGKAWKDTNKNGAIDDDEEAMVGINVYLLDGENGQVVKKENKPLVAITNNRGIYEFNNIPAGQYIVAFEYNVNDYRVTTYKQDGVTEDYNSDVISKNIDINGTQKIYAVTDKFNLEKTTINICAGFIKNEVFDLKLDKYVSKIIVQNNAGTSVKSYENTKLAKTEIHRKQLANSTVIIEYTINITNEGELAGYIGDVIDYIPKDLKFSSELNKDWYMSTDGNLHNITLADLTLDPGKTTTLNLILTKTMTNNNTGTVINTAEIGKASNKFSINDIDSTPANGVETEDDYGKAEVIISVATGAEVYITVSTIIIILLITTIGLYIIKKKKEGKNE